MDQLNAADGPPRRRVLITGGAGFIGSHLAESLHGEAEVRVLDDLSTGSRSNIEGIEADLIEGSILDEGLLRRAARGAEHVYHLAAVPGVAESLRDPARCREVNVRGTLRVLEAARAAGVKKVFFAGSAAVYGNRAPVPRTEEAAPDPRSPYAASKLAGERLCRFYSRKGLVRTVTLRFFNVFGPLQRSNGGAAVASFLVRALQGRPLEIHGGGGQTRDFLYVKDAVLAVRHVTEREAVTGVFNAGSGRPVSVKELAGLVLKLTGSS